MKNDAHRTPQESVIKPGENLRLRSHRKAKRLLGASLLSVLAWPFLLTGFHEQARAQSGAAAGQVRELNVYSARHYASDNDLYAEFTKQTGIRINQIQASDEAILERIKSEGRASPADVILLADAARLAKAQSEGLFQRVSSPFLEKTLPAVMQSDGYWFGFTTRARIIVFDKKKIKPDQVRNYSDLASPALRGMVCTRSGSHPYMLSLLASIIEHEGEAKAQVWASGVVANLARTPRGGDTDQIKGVISGECAVALTNSYYLVRLMKSAKADEREGALAVGISWPNQSGRGTHVNVSGGGIAKHAPHPDAGRRFLEFLASAQAQTQLANANNEWPAVPGLAVQNPELMALGKFKADPLPVVAIGKSQAAAARIMDRAGWK